jgi:hypothetical protein
MRRQKGYIAPDRISKRSQKKRLRAEEARLLEQGSAVDADRDSVSVSATVRPLEVRETIEERLPAALAGQDKWMYVKSTEIWHSQTGGCDEPSPASLKTSRGIPAPKANVVITFREADNILFTAGSLKGVNKAYGENDSDSMEIDPVVGNDKGKQKASATPTPAEVSAIAAVKATAAATAAAKKLKAKSEPKEPNYHPVKVQWILNSQVPGFYLEVRRTVPKFGDKEEVPVTVHFHVNNMLVRKTANTPDPKICLVSSLGKDTAARLDPNSGLEAHMATGTGCLWSTEVEVWRTGHPMPNAALTNAEATFANITREELDIIKSVGDAAMKSKLSKESASSILSQGDWVLYGLLTCTSFAMYRTWSSDPESTKVYDYFTRYMRALLNEVALMGNFPFYARQANEKLTNLHSGAFKIGEAVPPRNMVKKWRVKTVNHQPVSDVAETWSAFAPLKVYPESRAKTFAMRLGIARTRPYELAAVQEAVDKFMGKIRCRFMKLSQVGTYYGEAFLSNNKGKIFGENGVKSPVPNTRLIMKVASGQFAGKKFAGVVVPDVYGRERNICVSVYLQKGHAEFPLHSSEFEVEIEFKDDTTPCDRQDAAIIQLGRGTERTCGVDFQSVLLDTPPVICNTGSVAEEVKDSAMAKAECRMGRHFGEFQIHARAEKGSEYELHLLIWLDDRTRPTGYRQDIYSDGRDAGTYLYW